jgi:hypothetical protein
VWGSGIAAPFFIFSLDGGEWSVSRTGLFTPPEKEAPVPTGEEARWAPEPGWKLWRREKSYASAENRTPAVQPVAIPSELPRFLECITTSVQLTVHEFSSSQFSACRDLQFTHPSDSMSVSPLLQVRQANGHEWNLAWLQDRPEH